MNELDVWMNGRHVGVWRKIRGDRDQLVYHDAWLRRIRSFGRYQLSSAPLPRHGKSLLPSFDITSTTCLPDNSQIRGKNTGSGSTFDLQSHSIFWRP